MGRKNTRGEILERLHKKMAQGKGLLVAATGSGLNAKSAEAGGTDILMILHTGRMRQMGLPSIATPPKSPNEMVREMFPEQVFATKDIPLLAGITVGEYDAQDNLDGMIDAYLELGASGVVNFMSSGEIGCEDFLEIAGKDEAEDGIGALRISGEQAMFEECRRREERGVGFAREVELIRRCHERDIFTITYVFSEQQAADMARAGADGVIPHCGGTGGGMVGHNSVLGYEAAAARIQRMFDAARAVNPEILLFGHGGPFASPEDTVWLYKLTNAQGFVAGSGLDRLPIEKAITSCAEQFGEAMAHAGK